MSQCGKVIPHGAELLSARVLFVMQDTRDDSIEITEPDAIAALGISCRFRRSAF